MLRKVLARLWRRWQAAQPAAGPGGRRSTRRLLVEPLEDRLAPATTRFGVIGDYGFGDAEETAVANLVKSWNPEFIATVGDNNYPDGAASTIDRNIGRDYRQFIHPYLGSYGAGASTNRFWPTIGNHDYSSNGGYKPYLDYFTLPHNERYYSFTWGSVGFFMLNSDIHEPDGRSSTSVQGTWLRNQLAASTAPWKVVMLHHAPYDPEGGGSAEMRWPYKEWGADAVLAGHLHVYGRVMVDGLAYFTNGFGRGLGAVRVEASNTSLTFEAVRTSGLVIDSLTLTQNGSPTPQANVSVTATDANASEPGSNTGRFTVARTGSTTAPLTVSYLVGGTATNGLDYNTLPGTVTIPAGAASAVITVTPKDDPYADGTETVIVALTSGTGYTAVSPSSGTVKIVDDGDTVPPLPPPNVSIQAGDDLAGEAAGELGSFTITRTGDTSAALTVAYTAAGSASSGADYTALPGTLTIAAGATSGVLVVSPKDDTTIENSETVIVTLSSSNFYVLGAASAGAASAVVAILDNETSPSSATTTVTITASDASAAEPSNTGAYTVTRTGSTSAALTVKYGVSGTATSGSDYQALSGTVTIAAGASSATITLTPKDDTGLEVDETVVVALNAGNDYLVGTPSNASVVVVDNETPRVTITATDTSASEPGIDTGLFTVTRTGNTGAALTVGYTLGGTATSGSDYQVLSGSLTIPAGASAATIKLTPLDDDYVEGPQTLALNLAASAAYTLGASTSAAITIVDNDAPLVTIAAADPSAAEAGPDGGTFTITRSGGTDFSLIVNYALGGTATNGSDYTTLPGSITIPAGASSATITVEVVDDPEPESTERVTIALSPDPLYVLESDSSSAAVNVIDNDPALAFATTEGAVAEGDDRGLFTIRRLGGNPDLPLTVAYAVAGTAVPGLEGASDYETLSGTATIPAGSPSVSVHVTPWDDLDIEPSKTVVVTLSSSADYGLVSPSTMTIFIRDNDSVVSIEATDSTAAETGLETGAFTISRLGDLSEPLVVFFDAHGTALGGPNGTGDYETLEPDPCLTCPLRAGPYSCAATIPAGQASVTVPVTPRDDDEVEESETVIATLSSSAFYTLGSALTATVSIIDNDYRVSVAAADATAAEQGADPGVFTVTRAGGDPNLPLTVVYTVSGSAVGDAPGSGDYEQLSGSVTIAAGSSEASVAVAPRDDADVEGPETIILTLSSSSAYALAPAQNATVDLVDNDLPTVTVAVADASAAEAGPDAGSFTFTRNGPTSTALTVSYTLGGTASSGDYTGATGTVIIPAGSASASVTVTPVSDAAVETSESVSVTVNPSSSYHAGPSGNAAIVILENRKLVPAGATWKYLDNGVNQGTAWRATSFADSTWKSAPAQLGYGEGDESTQVVKASGRITHYFRHAFTLVDAGQYRSLKVRLVRDDGAVVYLNGTEVFRSNMPAGAVSYTTLASASVNGADESRFFEANISSTLLVSGVNVIAVETHQSSSSSSDLSFDLELVGTLLPPTVSVMPVDSSAAEEGQGPAAFAITRTGDTAADLVVAYTLGGTATADDFTNVAGTATIAAGASSVTVVLTPQDDPDQESIETVTATLNTTGTYALGSPSSAAMTLLDNDATITIEATDATAAEEAQEPGVFTITRRGDISRPLTVSYRLGGTAGDSDYGPVTGTVTIAAGSASALVTITPENDAEAEDDETVVATLRSSNDYTVGAPSSAAITIVSDDPAIVTIEATDAGAAEQDQNAATYTVSRTGPTAAPLTVSYTLSGVATADDYAGPTGAVTIPAGAASATFTLTPADDADQEGSETVVAVLESSLDYQIGTPSSATVLILDNDPTVTIVATDDTASEAGQEPGVFTITRTGDLSAPLTVNYTMGVTSANHDYAGATGAVTIAAGLASATVTITPQDDGADEPDQTVTALLSDGSDYTVGTPASASLTILDDDLPAVILEAANSSAAEAGSEPGTFTITRTGDLSEPLTVEYTLSGSAGSGDYTGATGAVTIEAGLASATVTVTPQDDGDDENDETLVATLSSSGAYNIGTPDSAVIELLDNDPLVTIAATDDTAAEPSDAATFTLTRTGDLSVPLTVSYTLGGTAAAGDYDATGRTALTSFYEGVVVFEAGSATAAVTVTPADDSNPEGSETVSITLNSSSAGYMVGTANSAAVTILDNDTGPLTLIPAGATWRYLDNGSNQGTAWRGASFNDSSWKSGSAKFGFGEGNETTRLTSGKVAYYFRKTFTVENASAVLTQQRGLTLRLLRDDGAAVYLNGTEVFRSNLPATTLSYTTLASTTVSGTAEARFVETSISPSLLVNGSNVLAVEVHQASAGSSDLSFDVELIGPPQAPAPAPSPPPAGDNNPTPTGPLVAAGSTWKYLDNGTNQGTAWRASGFNDSAWKSGAASLGFGGGQTTALTAGKVTYYLRRAFTVLDTSTIDALTVRLRRDDGAVVYLNGVEVFRSNMPTGTITYTTLASTTVSDADESRFFETSVNPNLLVDGANLLAVEIHQAKANSSDVLFDLELIGS